MELYNGRPTDLTGREDREIRVYDLLDSLGIVNISEPTTDTLTQWRLATRLTLCLMC